jgi:hypothetical protein
MSSHTCKEQDHRVYYLDSMDMTTKTITFQEKEVGKKLESHDFRSVIGKHILSNVKEHVFQIHGT